MFILYAAVAIIAGIFGVVLFISGLAEGKWKEALIGVLLLLLVAGLIVIPNAKEDQLTYTHKVLLTDTYNDIKYNQVICVEYDERTGPWWAWQWLEADVNHKIIVGESK